MKEHKMSIKKETRKSLLQGNQITISGIEMNKITASSFALCETLDLAVITGKEGKYPQSEVLMFLYLHHIGARKARELIFNESEGVDQQGRSKAFINACMDWADTLSMSVFSELATATATLLQDAFNNAIETASEAKEGNAKKVA